MMLFIRACRQALEQIKKMNRNLREGAEMTGNYCEEMDRILKRKEQKMDALKLDIAAIRKRVLYEAVVASFRSGLAILIPSCDDNENGLIYMIAHTGGLIDLETHPALNWVIRPGDRAEFSDNGKDWHEGVYGGIHGNEMFNANSSNGFVFVSSNDDDFWRFIRPVPTDSPEKRRIMDEIKAAEEAQAESARHLAALKKQAEGMK